jgi:hypothetical protein
VVAYPVMRTLSKPHQPHFGCDCAGVYGNVGHTEGEGLVASPDLGVDDQIWSPWLGDGKVRRAAEMRRDIVARLG